MSGRIRTIKPEILEDEVAASLSHAAWRLWVSCFLLADDYGNFRASPTYLLGQVFWSSSRESRESVAKVLEELASCKNGGGLITLYSVRGQPYAHINGWGHQRVDKPGKPRCPGPQDADSGESRECLARVSREPRESLAPDLLPPTPTCTYDLLPPNVATSVSAKHSLPPSPVVLELPLLAGKVHGVTEADVEAWGKAYPAVDILAEIRRAREWLVSNPTKAKRNGRAFLTRWLGRAQERGGGSRASPAGTDKSWMPTLEEANRGLTPARGR